MNEIAKIAEVDLTNVYLVVGALVIMNLGGLFGAFWFLLKVAWVASKYDSRIEKMETDIHQAFVKIKELKESFE